MPNIEKLILASGSPYRKQLLETTGLQFEVVSPDVDESKIVSPDPAELARLRSEAKATAVAGVTPHALVIGADQVMSCDGESFDKVHSREAAYRRLAQMSGKCHYLHSGFSLIYGEPSGHARIMASYIVDVPMQMRNLSPREIGLYVETDEWQGSVGCYKVERKGINLFSEISSDYSSIVGLPLVELINAFRDIGINPIEFPNPPWNV